MRPLLVAIYFAFSSACLAANEPPSAYLALCAELDLATISEIELVASTGQAPGEEDRRCLLPRDGRSQGLRRGPSERSARNL